MLGDSPGRCSVVVHKDVASLLQLQVALDTFSSARIQGLPPQWIYIRRVRRYSNTTCRYNDSQAGPCHYPPLLVIPADLDAARIESGKLLECDGGEVDAPGSASGAEVNDCSVHEAVLV